ncbi:MAG: acetylxylan esterase [Candidatus Sumerlaeaceae bacterium]|nr:acetylxylan esterase [Candidatus Sumerlaeaceae bacterium]
MAPMNSLMKHAFFAAAFAATSLAVAQKPTGPKFEFDPAEQGGPQLLSAGFAEPPGNTLVTVSDIGQPTSHTLWSQKVLPSSGSNQGSFSLNMRPAAQDTFADIAVSTAPAPAAPIFRARTVLRPEGKPLISYQGKRDLAPPSDFAEYWKRAKRELDQVPLSATLTRVPEKDTATGLLYRVDLDTVRKTTIVCWYYVPRNTFDSAGKATRRCPAMLIAPGYGAEEPPIDRTSSGVITLSLNPRHHGPSKQYWKSPVEHMLYNIEDPENCYYKLAFLDCLRGAQFLFSRTEVDPKRVATEGGSQGGLFAIATAALEPRIACVCSNVTAFSAYPEGMLLAQTGHHVQFREKLAASPPDVAAKIRKTLSYMDGANMATLVHCPVQINMGGIDPVCPFVCGIVTYNKLPAGVAKEIHVIPGAKHEVPGPMRANNSNWYRRYLGL